MFISHISDEVYAAACCYDEIPLDGRGISGASEVYEREDYDRTMSLGKKVSFGLERAISDYLLRRGAFSDGGGRWGYVLLPGESNGEADVYRVGPEFRDAGGKLRACPLIVSHIPDTVYAAACALGRIPLDKRRLGGARAAYRAVQEYSRRRGRRHSPVLERAISDYLLRRGAFSFDGGIFGDHDHWYGSILLPGGDEGLEEAVAAITSSLSASPKSALHHSSASASRSRSAAIA